MLCGIPIRPPGFFERHSRRLSRLRLAAGLLALMISLIAAGNAEAFNGTRKGFILGGGLGFGMSSFTQEVTVTGFGSETTDRESKSGLATDFKIGGGINEQVLLYYVNRISWFGIENVLGESVTVANGVGLVGLSYYLKETGPGGYLVGTIGIASWDTPFESDTDMWTGFGIGVGGGFEFSPHWSVEGTVNFGNPGREESGIKAESNATSVLVTLCGLAY